MAARGELPAGVFAARLEPQPPDRFVRLRAPLGVSSFGINQIVLAPGERGRIHTHAHQEEVYLVLDGTLTLIVEGAELDFEAGELARVPPELRRQLLNRGPGPVSLLALGGMVAHEHVSRDATAYTAWEGGETGTPQEIPLPEPLPASELR